MLGTKEFYDLMDQFEKAYKAMPIFGHKVERAERVDMNKKNYYHDGTVNLLFIAYMHGYQYGKYTERE